MVSPGKPPAARMPAPAAQSPGQLRGMARMPAPAAQSAPAPVRPIPVAHSRPTQPVAIPTHFTAPPSLPVAAARPVSRVVPVAPPPLQPFTHVVAQPAAPMATTAAPIGHIRFGTRPIVLSKADVQPAIAVNPANESAAAGGGGDVVFSCAAMVRYLRKDRQVLRYGVGAAVTWEQCYDEGVVGAYAATRPITSGGEEHAQSYTEWRLFYSDGRPYRAVRASDAPPGFFVEARAELALRLRRKRDAEREQPSTVNVQPQLERQPSSSGSTDSAE